MTRRWILLLALALAGCAGFEDYYFDGSSVISETAEPPCGCQAGPRVAPIAAAPYAAPNMITSASPQSREPELLR
jgi:hypothetical protein